MTGSRLQKLQHYYKAMDKRSTVARLSVFLLILTFCSSTKACSKDSDCDDDHHCCESHCTSFKIHCSELCFRDEDCSRDKFCLHNVCVKCSRRNNCEVKSCFNDTHCPTSHRCNHHMCKTKKPPKPSFTLLPFIIIIAVLGFALVVLCYTEGCWKEILLYLKRYFGRYGRIARDEQEADQRELGERERGSHSHSNKTCVLASPTSTNLTNHLPSTQNNTQPTTTNHESPNTLRNTQVISHNNEIRTMPLLSETRPSRSITTIMTSSSDQSCQQTSRTSDSVDVGSLPSLSDQPHTINRNLSPLPPSYCSLFSEENEEPPPKYEEVVLNGTAFPICIEMNCISPRTLSLNHSVESETPV